MSDEEQANLTMQCAAPNKRPVKNDAMRRRACEIMMDRLVSARMWDADDVDGAVEDLMQVTKYEDSDGYRIARELDRQCGWNNDGDYADKFDQFWGILHDLFRKAETQWAAENMMKQEFFEGDQVVWRDEACTICGVTRDLPFYYLIRTAICRGSSEILVPFEDVS